MKHCEDTNCSLCHNADGMLLEDGGHPEEPAPETLPEATPEAAPEATPEESSNPS